ncbi:hypothetical protein DPMN_061340 [Dreissena polymorpha]|uniref:Uncharacterized protein n=1 Tax=Dreissena polymorpha TaxID=45954 RepID=A0A9D4HGU6_DREPO|nr:hypothetical protein DPMN_061340 [Dreissena polymorpha]
MRSGFAQSVLFERNLERENESKTFCEVITATLLINESLTLGDIIGHKKHKASSLKSIQLGGLLITKKDQLPYTADNRTQGMSLNDDLSATTAVIASKDNKNSTKSTVNTRRSSTLLTPERSPMQSKSPQNRSGSSRTDFRESPASVGNIQTPKFAKSAVVIADDFPLKLLQRVSLESDKLPMNITSSPFFDDGVIVLCGTANKKLLLFQDYKQKSDLGFASSPHHIAHIPRYGIAVTFPNRTCIQYIRVTNGILAILKYRLR